MLCEAGAAESPSSQRAWIEIAWALPPAVCFPVALLAEGVDRNDLRGLSKMVDEVALLAEGVDRNKYVEVFFRAPDGRPPRRGRG